MKINKSIILFLFFLTSFLGWCIETFGTYIVTKEWMDRGILSLPFCPIYGICVTFIFLVLKAPSFGYMDMLNQKYILENSKMKRYTLYASYAIIFGLICGIVEYYTGLFIDVIGMKQLWTYEGYIDSINGYIRLTYVFLFGLFGLLYMRFIYKNIYQYFLYKDKTIIQIINISLSIALLIDVLSKIIDF